MFDPTVPTHCDCGLEDCASRQLEGQRVRAITDPSSGVPFVHPQDVVECMNATITHILDISAPDIVLGVPLTVAVSQFVADWISDPQHHVPAGYAFSTGTPAAAELAALISKLDRGDITALDEVLQKILEQS